MSVRYTVIFALCMLMSGCNKPEPPAATPKPADQKISGTHDVGCGMCIYKLQGQKGCITYVSVEGMPLLLKGVDVNAHAIGLCEQAGKATVTGKVENGRLIATDFKLIELVGEKQDPLH